MTAANCFYKNSFGNFGAESWEHILLNDVSRELFTANILENQLYATVEKPKIHLKK